MSYFISSSATFQPVVAEALNEVQEQQFVGAQILPLLATGTKQGEYVVVKANQFDNDISKPRAAGANFANTSSEIESATFNCQEFGLEQSLDDLSIAEIESDAQFDIVAAASRNIARSLMVGHELRVANALSGAAFNSTAATAAFSNASGATPINDVNNAVQRLNANGIFTGIQLIIESSLYQEMVQTDDMRSLINGSGALSYSQDQVAKVLGVDGIIICNSRYNSAKKGQDAARTKVWSDSSFYVGAVSGGPLSNNGIGRTMFYTGRQSGAFVSETFRTEQPPANVVRVRMMTDELICNTLAAEKITGA